MRIYRGRCLSFVFLPQTCFHVSFFVSSHTTIFVSSCFPLFSFLTFSSYLSSSSRHVTAREREPVCFFAWEIVFSRFSNKTSEYFRANDVASSSSFFLPLVKNWHFAFSFLFHFASPLFFFLFIAFLTNFAYVCTCILQVERKAFSFFSFFFSVQGVLRCYNIPVFKLDCAFSDDVPLVSTWSFSMSFFFFPLSFFYSLWYYRRIN